MLLLTSTTDQLQVTTSVGTVINVHASWVDTNTSTGAITPGNTNTVISSATTATVVGPPASGVQRNIRTLHLHNTGSLACDCTIQHTDGTTIAQLLKRTLAVSGSVGDWLQYTDKGGFNTPPKAPQVTVLSTVGAATYTTPIGALYLDVQLVGGGGGGSAGAVVSSNGTNGVHSFFQGGGLTLDAEGGSGAGLAIGAVGGTASGGDININGGWGGTCGNLGNGSQNATGGNGGASFFGSGGSGGYASVGEAAGNVPGAGGGGGSSIPAEGGGGGGAGGYCRKLIASPAPSYSCYVGDPGQGGIPTAGPGGYAGAAGAPGIIIVRAFF